MSAEKPWALEDRLSGSKAAGEAPHNAAAVAAEDSRAASEVAAVPAVHIVPAVEMAAVEEGARQPAAEASVRPSRFEMRQLSFVPRRNGIPWRTAERHARTPGRSN